MLQALRPEANAFVLNVNAISVAVAGESSGTERMAVDHHIDDTLRVGQTAKWVTVLVLHMPPTSIDGELTLHVPAKEGTELFSSSSPDAVISPRENRMIEFRGELIHAVRPLRPLPGGASDGHGSDSRVSVVLEQYILNQSAYEIVRSRIVRRRRGAHRRAARAVSHTTGPEPAIGRVWRKKEPPARLNPSRAGMCEFNRVGIGPFYSLCGQLGRLRCQ